MKSPEQIAAEVLDDHANQPHFRRNREQIDALIQEAIHLDRAQMAARVIAQKVWLREDFESHWEGILQERYPNLTEDEVEAIIDDATTNVNEAALADCTDSEWAAIEEALEDAAVRFTDAS